MKQITPDGSKSSGTKWIAHVSNGRFGRGLFADRAIKSGSEIVSMVGELISFSEAVQKGEFESYALQISKTMYLDTEAPGCFVNHSCDPNAGIVLRDGVRWLVALRKIGAGEEILYDYSTTMDEAYWELTDCRCGSIHCRGTIRDFRHLSRDLQDYYIRLGVVEDFIIQGIVNPGVSVRRVA